jgi:hypothetical protein
MYVAAFSELFNLLRLGVFDQVYFHHFFVQVSTDLVVVMRIDPIGKVYM